MAPTAGMAGSQPPPLANTITAITKHITRIAIMIRYRRSRYEMSSDLDRCASVTRCALVRRPLRMTITTSSYAPPRHASSPGGSGGEAGVHSDNDAMIIARRARAPPRPADGERQAADGGGMTARAHPVTGIVG